MMGKKQLTKYLTDALKRHGKIKVRMWESGSPGMPSRERILTKNGSCVVRYFHPGQDLYNPKDKWSRYHTSCFVEVFEWMLEDDRRMDKAKAIVEAMMDYDRYDDYLKLVEVRVGKGFKKELTKWRKRRRR